MITTARVAYAIPTWNRSEAVVRAARAALKPARGVSAVPVLVHDDGSTDGTSDALASLQSEIQTAGVELHVSSARSNAGYGAALLALLRRATSVADVVILCADDDLPLPQGVQAVVTALERSGADMLSTPVPRGGGRPGFDRLPPRDRRVTAPELRAIAAHAPGIVLRTATLNGALDLLERRLDLGCAFAHTYPQGVVAVHLLAYGRVRWGTTPVVATGLALPTGIRGPGGGTYREPVERWQQWIALQDLLEDELRAATGPVQRRLRAIRSAEDVQLMPHLRSAFAERHEDARRFDRAGARTYRDGPIRRPTRWLRSLARTPERTYLVAKAGDLLRRILETRPPRNRWS